MVIHHKFAIKYDIMFLKEFECDMGMEYCLENLEHSLKEEKRKSKDQTSKPQKERTRLKNGGKC